MDLRGSGKFSAPDRFASYCILHAGMSAWDLFRLLDPSSLVLATCPEPDVREEF